MCLLLLFASANAINPCTDVQRCAQPLNADRRHLRAKARACGLVPAAVSISGQLPHR